MGGTEATNNRGSRRNPVGLEQSLTQATNNRAYSEIPLDCNRVARKIPLDCNRVARIFYNCIKKIQLYPCKLPLYPWEAFPHVRFVLQLYPKILQLYPRTLPLYPPRSKGVGPSLSAPFKSSDPKNLNDKFKT